MNLDDYSKSILVWKNEDLPWEEAGVGRLDEFMGVKNNSEGMYTACLEQTTDFGRIDAISRCTIESEREVVEPLKQMPKSDNQVTFSFGNLNLIMGPESRPHNFNKKIKTLINKKNLVSPKFKNNDEDLMKITGNFPFNASVKNSS